MRPSTARCSRNQAIPRKRSKFRGAASGPEFDKFAEHQRRNQDGNERDGIVLSCALAHLVQLGFIVWVVAHQNHPRSGKQQRRIPEKPITMVETAATSTDHRFTPLKYMGSPPPGK